MYSHLATYIFKAFAKSLSIVDHQVDVPTVIVVAAAAAAVRLVSVLGLINTIPPITDVGLKSA